MEAATKQRVSTAANWMSIFTSASTLVCCALPALLVALGAGATLLSLIGAFPQLIWISEHKVEVFVLAGVMLAVAGTVQWRARRLPCPIDPTLAQACIRQRRLSWRIYAVSCFIYLVGGFFAFIAPLLI